MEYLFLPHACLLFNTFKPTWYLRQLRGIQQVFARLIWRKGIGADAEKAEDWESKPCWKCNFTITDHRTFLITGQAKVSKDLKKAGLQVDFSSSALSILQDFWSPVLVFMELSKVNVAAVAWGLRNCMQVKTWIQKWQPTDCDQKKMSQFFYLGQGSGGRRKCRWRLWWVRLQWKGRAGIWKQSVREPSPTFVLWFF